MSQTYVGPFGRILPLPARSETPEAVDQSSRMLAGQIQLPLPTRLNFGSDPRPGFPISRPAHVSSARLDGIPNHSRAFAASRSTLSQEKLPSVSQLLTPGPQNESPLSHPPPSATLYSSPSTRPGPDHEAASVYQSPQTGILSGSHLISDGEYFQPYHSRSPRAVQHESGHSFSARSGTIGHDNNYRLQGDHRQGSNRPSSDPTGSASSISAHNGSGSTAWYHAQSSQFDPVRASSSNSEASRNDVGGASGPVVRLVGEQVFPGEGLCYVYDDGTHVKKVIDGEKVNGQWGITKAGKPRKRLAIACMTCREKKIKCDPAEPKCVQCEKSGRECRFQTAPRQVHKPGSPSYEQQARTSSSMSDRKEQYLDFGTSPSTESCFSASTNELRYRSSSQGSSTQQVTSPDCLTKLGSLKKRRRDPLHDPDQPSTVIQLRKEDAGNSSDWDVGKDPYLLDPHLTLQSVSSCLMSYNSFFSEVFPPKAFLHWVQTSASKKREEIMVLYAMIAMGLQCTDKAENESKSTLFFGIAKESLERNATISSVHLVQARLLISEYLTATGDANGGIDFIGSATSAALNQRLNIEREEQLSSGDRDLGTYGLNHHAWAECRRRTFWFAFLLDRYQALAADRPTLIQKEDVVLRLPCDNADYEEQVKTCTPCLDNRIVDERLSYPDGRSSPIGLLGYHVQSSSVFGDVLRECYRARNQSRDSYLARYEQKYTENRMLLHRLVSSLPEHLKLSMASAKDSVEHGYSLGYTSLHAGHFLNLMILNRRIRPDLFPTSKLVRNTKDAIQSARLLLNTIHTLLEAPKFVRPSPSSFTPPPSPGDDPQQARDESNHVFRCTREFTAYCTLYCADILSSAGSLEDTALNETLGDMELCHEIIDRLSQDSHEIPPMKLAIRCRFRDVQALSSQKSKGMRAWAFKASILRDFGPEKVDMDLFYSAENPRRVLEARGLDVAKGTIVVLS